MSRITETARCSTVDRADRQRVFTRQVWQLTENIQAVNFHEAQFAIIKFPVEAA